MADNPQGESPQGGRCTMRGSCGSKGVFGKPLPCPYDGPPVAPDDSTRNLIASVCGDTFAQGDICCNSDQLEVLRDNLVQAESIISPCPACRNNFREFFCHLTCSPNQASFINITSTQATSTGQTAVQSLDFFVADELASGFYDSCKNVQFGASNSYAMDFIGGGAKNYTQFLSFLGDEKPLGSPFQIDFPRGAPTSFAPLDVRPRHCSDNNVSSKCACIDCPAVCPSLPPPPDSDAICHVGAITCLSFILILAYSLCFVSFMTGYGLQSFYRRRKYERLATAETSSETPLSPTSHHRPLVGASSLARHPASDLSAPSSWDPRSAARGISLLDPVESVQPRQYRLNDVLRRWFYRGGFLVASRPWLTFTIIFTLVGLLNIGWANFAVEKDPVKLWVAPNSESRLQKEYFDQNFGPFFRPEQIFITSSLHSHTPPPDEDAAGAPVLSWDHLKYWFQVESDIRALRSSPNNYTLDDVCFKPIGPDGACVVQSVTAWFGNDIDSTTPEDWPDRLLTCAKRPVECLPDFMQPLGPKYVMGGVPNGTDYLDAESLVVTIVVSDSLDLDVQARAMEWERTLRTYLLKLSERAPVEAGLRITFSTGVSLEEELNKSTNMDVKIVVLSYLAMFVYVSLTLGNGATSRDEENLSSSFKTWASNFPRLFSRSSLTGSSTSLDSFDKPHLFPRIPRKLFVGSRFTLGLFGISLVILSVSASVGFFSAVGVKVTLIIAEVIPFLVLAVGVDNVFILVNELDRQNMLHGPNAAAPESSSSFPPLSSPTRRHHNDSTHDESIEASSMPLFLSPEERVARTMARMGPSILLSSITETIAFLLGALVPMPAVRNFALYAAGSVFLNAILQMTVFVAALLLDLRRMEASRVDCFPFIKLPSRIQLRDNTAPGTHGPGILARLIRKYYAPFVLRPLVKGVIVLFFGGVFIASVISIQHIQLGLDQRLALPSDSYLVQWFNDLDKYLDIGPPVYFVSQDVNVTAREGQQHLCGRFTTCDELSFSNLLEVERKRTDVSYLSQPSASWIDDFLLWLNPVFEECCRVQKRDPSKFCGPRDRARNCQPCFAGREPQWNITMNGFPEGDEFMHYLKQWLVSPPSEDCPLGGQASYGDALSIQDNTVTASHFRTFFEPLKSQDDFISAFAAANRIADELSESTGAPVFPYSLFFVFFDQYAHIVSITQEVLGLGLAAVLVVTSLFLGSWRTGAIITGIVAFTVVNVMGFMALWGISLNALSLVNLVISLGIAVEFCAHIARAFMTSGAGDRPPGQKERDERMWTALTDVGPSVLSGITFTKLIGMCVLALTRSKLLEIYYFRMWITLIVSGALHGLVLLPVILSLAGGPGFPMQEADEEWMSNALRNDYEYTPFLADDASYHSD